LRKLKAETEGDRENWERFVLIKVDGRGRDEHYPRLLPGAPYCSIATTTR